MDYEGGMDPTYDRQYRKGSPAGIGRGMSENGGKYERSPWSRPRAEAMNIGRYVRGEGAS